jgi:glutamate/tyrosine decarboxylase-like PLP-dependent enzyme
MRQGFGGIYIDLESHEETQHQVFGLFADSNALYPDLFPALRKFEAEVVRMACTMLAGDDQATHPTPSSRACRHTIYACICLYLWPYGLEFQTCGTMTSGGTESILMAVKTYRESARKRNPGIKPQMYPALAPPPNNAHHSTNVHVRAVCVSRIVPVSAHAAFAKARTTRHARHARHTTPCLRTIDLLGGSLL